MNTLTHEEKNTVTMAPNRISTSATKITNPATIKNTNIVFCNSFALLGDNKIESIFFSLSLQQI
jgi:hypothetical protein